MAGRLGLTVAALFWPLLLLASGAALSLPYGAHGGIKASSAMAAVAYLAPYLAALPGALLAWWFNHGRVVFMLALLVLAHFAVHAFVSFAPGADVNGQVIYAALCFLIPINIAVFALIGERGIFSIHGLTRSAWILIQAAIVMAASGAGKPGSQMAAKWLHFRLFDSSLDAWTHVTQPGLLLYAVSALVLLARALLARGAAARPGMDGGALGALLASAAALHVAGRGLAPPVFFTVAALILILAVIQDAYRMAFLDELTGLPGRRALTAAMKDLGSRYCVAMIDVDFFKKFNDSYGHDAGDQVLQMVASKLAAAGGGSRAFRYGGEEFTMLFPGKSMDEAHETLERARKSVASSGFALRGKDRPKDQPKSKPKGGKNSQIRAQEVNVTISIGAAGKGKGRETPEEALRAADLALYRAKNNGRNQVSI